jgi:hypothetical protein
MTPEREETLQEAVTQQRGAIIASLPVLALGVFLMIFALVNAVWPADYVNATMNDTASHWERLTSEDEPDTPEGQEPPEVERYGNHTVRRVVDGMAYFAVVQAIVAMIGLTLMGERYLYLLPMVSGLFGLIYSAMLGLIIGPILFATGSALVLVGGIMGFLTTRNVYTEFAEKQRFADNKGMVK